MTENRETLIKFIEKINSPFCLILFHNKVHLVFLKEIRRILKLKDFFIATGGTYSLLFKSDLHKSLFDQILSDIKEKNLRLEFGADKLVEDKVKIDRAKKTGRIINPWTWESDAILEVDSKKEFNSIVVSNKSLSHKIRRNPIILDDNDKDAKFLAMCPVYKFSPISFSFTFIKKRLNGQIPSEITKDGRVKVYQNFKRNPDIASVSFNTALRSFVFMLLFVPDEWRVSKDFHKQKAIKFLETERAFGLSDENLMRINQIESLPEFQDFLKQFDPSPFLNALSLNRFL